MPKIFLNALFLLVSLMLPSQTLAGPDYSGALLAFPSECRNQLKDRGGVVTCKIPLQGGTSIKIDLVFDKFTINAFAKQIGVTREKFIGNPRGYMRGALKHFEKMAVKQRDSGRGRIQIIAQSVRPARATKAQRGLDECLYFMEDAHVSERSGKYLARVDVSGVRCLGFDTALDRVWYTYVEIGAVHKSETRGRLPNFDDYTARILRSLKLN
ncbi:hypothetical protein PEL8287_00971 [Roseovarius litorisediminis]|uniref:Uncharacterized protein n=1 Tax=Roseovarius litorisediminis TaxID=1312363 RepID=A0A1Y5RPD2_9RHOB|nr:hypothetical protein [Roseovarius litorisediminis]SLN22256.1 hypothetical protein PEL8287_00971 [Roseovarius litorisediminis]